MKKANKDQAPKTELGEPQTMSWTVKRKPGEFKKLKKLIAKMNEGMIDPNKRQGFNPHELPWRHSLA